MKIITGEDGLKYVEGSVDYSTCLEAAGAEVLEYQSFGDYQGTWYAIIRVNGKISLVFGSYGSCSGCDALESELGWTRDIKMKGRDDAYGHLYDDVVKFGKPYLDDCVDIGERIKGASDDSSWDCEAEETVKWLKDMKEKYFSGGKS